MPHAEFELLFSNARFVTDSGKGFIRQLEQAFAIRKKDFTGGSEAHLTRVAINQMNTEFTFQGSNLLADGGLRHMKHSRRAGKTAKASYKHKNTQPVDI